MSHPSFDNESQLQVTSFRRPYGRDGLDFCYSTSENPRRFTERRNTGYGEGANAQDHDRSSPQPTIGQNDNNSLIQYPVKDTEEEDLPHEQTTNSYGRYDAQLLNVLSQERRRPVLGTSERDSACDGLGIPSHNHLHRRYTDRPHVNPYQRPQFEDYVRSRSFRQTSQGRMLFSPSGLRDSKICTSRNGETFPLLPITELDETAPLSRAAAEFAAFSSGDFQGCIKHLEKYEGLLNDEGRGWYLQEAWKAIWDREGDHTRIPFSRKGDYAHQCLSRWFLLDMCNDDMDSNDLNKYINSRHFKPKEFWSDVDSMYDILKKLRLSIIRGSAQVAKASAGGMAVQGYWTWLPEEAKKMFAMIDRAKVLGNIGKAYRLVNDLRNEWNGAS